MVILKSFWTPCLWVDNTKTGSFIVAAYTMALSIIQITLIIYQMLGGDSSQIYNPLFEMDLRDTLLYWGCVFLIIFVTLFIFSNGLIVGIKIYNRGFMLPWMFLFGTMVILQALFGAWLMYGYYIYLEVVLFTFIIWLWTAYNFYCWLCVMSQYQIIRELQSPNIELLWP